MRRTLLGGLVMVLAAAGLGGCGGSASTTAGGAQTSAGAPGATTSGVTTTSRSATSAPTRPFSGRPQTTLQVHPQRAGRRSTLTFSFVSPVATGTAGDTETVASLSVSGTIRSGCVGAHAIGLAPLHVGERVAARLGPAQLSGSWCAGAYVARVTELARAACAAGQMCPQFIRLVGLIGEVRFVITG